MVSRLPEPTRIKDETERRYFNELLKVLRFELSSLARSIASNLTLITANSFDNTVIVKSVDDLAVIEAGKTYFIDGVIDVGSTEIEIPTTGARFVSDSINSKGLYSTADNHTMFKSPGGSYSGDLKFSQMFLASSGTNSKLFDVDNDSNNAAIEFVDVNLGQFGYGTTTELGDISNYRQFRAIGAGFILVGDGFTFNGTMSGGIVVESSIALALPAMTLIKEGASLTVDNFRSDINFKSVNAASVFTDFDAANIDTKGGMALTNVRTDATDIVPNLSPTDVKARFKNCNGVDNTYVGAQWQITTSSTTTIASANTPVKVAGTTTYVNEYWFTNTTDNAFVYEGGQKIEIEAKGLLSFSGGNNDQINVFFRKWDDSASAYVDLPKTQATLNGGVLGTRAEGVGIFGYTTLEEDDRIEVWVENITDNTDVEALEGGLVSITERPS